MKIVEKIIKDDFKTGVVKKEELLYWIMYKAYEKTYGKPTVVDLSCLSNDDIYADKNLVDGIIADMISKGYSLYKMGIKVDSLMEKNSRVKTGSFYTPEALARGIVKITLSDYFKSKNQKLYIFFRELDKPKQFDEKIAIIAYNSLLELKVVDLSCGSGIFLLCYLNIIIDLYNRISKNNPQASLPSYNMANMFGYDIQNLPIEILKLSLLDLGHRSKFIENDVSNIRVCNSLLEEISPIFDIVLGNPPYIGEKGNRSIFLDMKKTDFGKKYYEGKMDYFYYFMYKGTEILRHDGILGYITTNYFTTADGATNLRNFISKNYRFETLINFNDLILFPSAPGQHNMVFTMRCNDCKTVGMTDFVDDIDSHECSGTRISVVNKSDYIDSCDFNNLSEIDYYVLEYDKVFNDRNKIVLTQTGNFHCLLEKIIGLSNMSLGDFISVKQGIVSGADKVSRLMMDKKLSTKTMKDYNIKKDDPIFVFDKGQLADVEESLLMPFYKNSDIDRYKVNSDTEKRIIYINQGLESFETQYPKTFKHLVKFRSVLDMRREVKNGMKPWYCLQWGREQEIFVEERIVVPQRSIKNCFGYGVKDFYASADVYYLKIEDNLGIDPKSLNYYLLGILNSRLCYFWLYNMGKRKGNLLELYSKPISEIPIMIDSESEFFSKIVSIVSEIVENKGDMIENQSMIDQLIYKEYRFDKGEIDLVNKLYSSMLDKAKVQS